jgi:NADH-quinone oxidoreductase subunit G
MPTLTINGKEITVEPGTTIMRACEEMGVEVPHFCYHERLSIAGNCRMCLVEMERSPKPIASCAMPATDGIVIYTDTPAVKKAREGVMEFLLINHPLDCPICDQGGECDLQDQAIAYGQGKSRYYENKRAVTDKDIGPLVKTTMTRCIHCTRCVRFATEVAGIEELGALGRGEDMEITSYLERSLESELSGNIIDLCPVGALTSKPYAFTARSWELVKTESIDVMDALGSNIRLDARDNQVMRILPRLNEDVNEEWISDKTRFHYDGLARQRLDRPYVKKKGKLQEAAWPEAFAAIAKKLKDIKGAELAGIVGDLADLESMYALKLLFDVLGSKRLECRQDGAAVETDCRAGYLFNSTVAGIEEADLLLLVGANPRFEAAVLNARIQKGVREYGLRVARIGPVADLTYPVEDLGDDAALLSDIISGHHSFSGQLIAAERPMVILGAEALQRQDGAALIGTVRKLADQFGFVSKGWNGFNVLHSAASRVGGLDLGLTAKGGINAILEDAASGETKAIFLLGADEFDTAKLKKAFVIYLGSHGDAGADMADVVLPGAAYSEKDGLYINTEGRVQEGLRAIFPPGDGRHDWTILRALSDVLGKPLPFDSFSELRDKLFADLPHLNERDAAPAAVWGKFGSDKAPKAGSIGGASGDYFLTNPIARASRILNEVQDLANSRPGEATGTDG